MGPTISSTHLTNDFSEQSLKRIPVRGIVSGNIYLEHTREVFFLIFFFFWVEVQESCSAGYLIFYFYFSVGHFLCEKKAGH